MGSAKGSYAKLFDRDEVIGAAVRTRDSTKPVFASIGHRVDLSSAIEIILSSSTKYRIPEPLRLAHNLSRRNGGRDSKKKLLLRIYRRLYEAFGPRHWWPGESPFEVIIGAILTQNTAWVNVEKAIRNLRDRNLLEPKKMQAVSVSSLAGLIKPAGYFNLKAERIKCFMEFLFSKYGGSLKRMFKRETYLLREELLIVKGIGPETADSILLYAAEKPIFVVDAYTRRMLSKLGLMDVRTAYDEIQRFFMDNLPTNVGLFNEFHALIVHLGKGICRGMSHSDVCPLKDITVHDHMSFRALNMSC